MAVPEDCSWLPKYPSRIIGLVLLGASFQPYYASSSFPVPSIAGWTPTYPSRIERKVQHPSQKPALFQAGRIALPSAPVPPLAWKAQHPDRIDRRRLPVADHPSYFSVPFARATQLTQFPSYPEQIRRSRVHPSSLPWSFFKLEAPPPFLSWKGEQPSRIDPKPGLSVASQRAYFFHPRAIPAPDPPGLGYATALYPAKVYPKVSLLTGRQQFFAFDVVPIPNPPPPTELTWLGSYPPFLRRPARVLPTEGVRVAPVMAAVSLGMRWAPSYPHFFRRHSVGLSATVAPVQVGAVLAVAPDLAWAPSYPDRLVRAVSVNDFAGFDPLSIASLLPFIPACVAVYDETVGLASITGVVSHASITEESVVQAGFDPEEFCP